MSNFKLDKSKFSREELKFLNQTAKKIRKLPPEKQKQLMAQFEDLHKFQKENKII